MKKVDKLFYKALTMAEVSEKYMLTATVFGTVLGMPSCMGPTPPHPPGT